MSPLGFVGDMIAEISWSMAHNSLRLATESDIERRQALQK